jgi:hypothetical protein
VLLAYPSHYYNATREGLRIMFADRFAIDELYTGANFTPDYTVNWVLNSVLASIRDEAVRARFAQTTILDLCREVPRVSEFWQTILRSLDDRAIAAVNSGNILVGTRKAEPHVSASRWSRLATKLRPSRTPRL